MNNFVITIARTYGSGGRQIGKNIADKLKIAYYDKEISKLASDDSGISEKLFSQNDEKIKEGFLKSSSKKYNGNLIAPNSNNFVSCNNLFNYQAKIIKQLAEIKSCVIVGRCADFVLKEKVNVIKVFIYANKDSCIKTVSDMYGLSEKKAKIRIDTIDKQRKLYYKHYTGHDWNDVENYDICLNTTNMSFEICKNIIEHFIYLKKF